MHAYVCTCACRCTLTHAHVRGCGFLCVFLSIVPTHSHARLLACSPYMSDVALEKDLGPQQSEKIAFLPPQAIVYFSLTFFRRYDSCDPALWRVLFPEFVSSFLFNGL